MKKHLLKDRFLLWRSTCQKLCF